MKKALKIIMILLMLIGIAISISNFMSVEIKAGGGGRGAWVYSNGEFICKGVGNDCGIPPE